MAIKPPPFMSIKPPPFCGYYYITSWNIHSFSITGVFQIFICFEWRERKIYVGKGKGCVVVRKAITVVAMERYGGIERNKESE